MLPQNILATPLRTVYCLLSSSQLEHDPEDLITHDPFWSQILAGVRGAVIAQHDGIRLRFSFLSDFLREADVTPRGRQWDEVGFIVLGDPRSAQWQQLIQLRGSIVQVHGLSRSRKIASVRADCAAGAEMLVDHLVALGHRRIAYCGVLDPSHRINYEKLKGYKRAMRRHGLCRNDELYYRHCLYGLEEGYRVIQPLLKLPERPTAAIVFNDETAIGAMRAVRDAGLSVPLDISIAGFDNIATSSFVIPSLTTISVRMSKLGELAVSRLLACRNDGERGPYVLRPELIVRESTAPLGNEELSE